MKGEEQLLRILEATRDQVASEGDRDDWFNRVEGELSPPDDGSDDEIWQSLQDHAQRYVSSGNEDELWSMIGGLYDLSRWYLDRPVTRVKGIGENRADKLDKLNIHTLLDLIEHYPRAYTDRRFVDDIRDVQEDQMVTILGEVLAGGVVQGRKPRYEVRLGDDTGTIRINFWNQTYLNDQLTKGKKLFCTGKVEDYRGTAQMNNPDFEIIEDDSDLKHSKGIKAIYPLTEGLHLKQLRQWIEHALGMIGDLVIDCIPRNVREDHSLIPYQRSLEQIHEPGDVEELFDARRRLVFEEFFFFQLLFVIQSWQIDETPKNRDYPRSEWRDDFLATVPFELTDDQTYALNEIENDLLSDGPMHRLLQGDVGTGKTVVAAASLLRVAVNGYQTALMAPTEVLAEQHYGTLEDLLEPIPCQVELLIGGINSDKKEETVERINNGEADLVVGTHALIQDSVDFTQLGYVVIDEQHRFGVEQRRNLREKGPDVDMLVMSATPIPRSLGLTRYGDLRFSTLETFPQGPKRITTDLLEQSDSNRQQVYRKVRKAIEDGHKAFFVFPAVEESEKTDMISAVESYEKATNSEFFKGIDLGLIHGQMGREEKQDRMRAFRDGDVQLLFSTTVIEVGIDVPEASYLVVHDAENYGLAQLHQLRGRIGRAGQKAYCYLLVDPGASEDSMKRLEVLERTQDGFEVSRADMKQRGMGNLAGTRQAGFQPFELGKIWEDRDLMEEAREAAEKAVKESRGLQTPESVLIKRKLNQDYSEAQNYVTIG